MGSENRLLKQYDPLWKWAWREGLAKVLSVAQLGHLLKACRDNDSTLLQGVTTVPPPMQNMLDWPCEGACAVGFAGWKDGKVTVDEVEEFFAKICYEADTLLGEPAAVRHFLNWFDSTPRELVAQRLAREVFRELTIRELVAQGLNPDDFNVECLEVK